MGESYLGKFYLLWLPNVFVFAYIGKMSRFWHSQGSVRQRISSFIIWTWIFFQEWIHPIKIFLKESHESPLITSCIFCETVQQSGTGQGQFLIQIQSEMAWLKELLGIKASAFILWCNWYLIVRTRPSNGDTGSDEACLGNRGLKLGGAAELLYAVGAYSELLADDFPAMRWPLCRWPLTKWSFLLTL